MTTTSSPAPTAPNASRRTHQMIFVNLPVADVGRSKEFFTSLGYGFNEEMCQADTAAALEIGPNIYAMLLGREFFGQFHTGDVAEPGQHEVLTCLSASSRADVDDLVDRAVAAGATEIRNEQNADFMYGRSFADLDSHIWEILWMDVEQAREAGAFG